MTEAIQSLEALASFCDDMAEAVSQPVEFTQWATLVRWLLADRERTEKMLAAYLNGAVKDGDEGQARLMGRVLEDFRNL